MHTYNLSNRQEDYDFKASLGRQLCGCESYWGWKSLSQKKKVSLLHYLEIYDVDALKYIGI